MYNNECNFVITLCHCNSIEVHVNLSLHVWKAGEVIYRSGKGKLIGRVKPETLKSVVVASSVLLHIHKSIPGSTTIGGSSQLMMTALVGYHS